MNLLASIFFADILPIFLIAATGYLLARFAEVDVKTVVRLVFFGLMPCLAFRMLITSTASGPNVGKLVLLVVLQMAVMATLGFAAAKTLRLKGGALRAFLMVVMFSNAGNYGLPVVQFAFGDEALTYATVFFIASQINTYTISSFFAESHRSRFAGALEKIAKMPALYGLAAAGIVLWTGVTVPESVMRPISMLSDAAIPVMILILGMQLQRTVWPSRPSLVFLAVGISLLLAPLVALTLSSVVGVEGAARQASVVQSSTPVAVVTIILALEFDLAPEFVTSAVFVSTLASPLTLTPLIAYLS